MAGAATPFPLQRLLQVVVAGVAMLAGSATFARTPQPSLRIALEPLDFQPLPAQVLTSGASVLTLNYVDPQHLLLTFNRRRLMARIPGDPETDVDRTIDAVLLELPTGKVLARTTWRLHDPGQYLWSVGEGHFLLRQRDQLTQFMPMEGLAAGDAFAQRPFIHSNRAIGSVLLSPSGDLLTLQTLDRSRYLPSERKPSPGTTAYNNRAAAAAKEESAPSVQIDFFRLQQSAADTSLIPTRAGAVSARHMILLPVDAAGFVSVIDEGKAHWAFNFNRHGGKVDELSPFDSSCHPTPFLVSRSEFVAFGCRGGQDSRELGGFNLRGEEMWEQTFTESFTAPAFSFAPASGRFALSRGLVSLPVIGEDEPGQLMGQNITVYQTESGRQIFSLNCNPSLRASQNFALSPKGEEVAIVNRGAIEIYPLPAPTRGERDAQHLAETLVPEQSSSPIRLAAVSSSTAVERKESVATSGKPQQTSAASVPGQVTNGETTSGRLPEIASPAPTPPGEPTEIPVAREPNGAPTELGDPQPQPGRKPPTLYGPDGKTPDEKHEGGATAASPK